MKSEERIAELIAEYLRKSDQLLDRMDHTDRSVDVMSGAIAANDIKFNAMNEKFNAMNEKFNEEIKQLRKDHNRLSEDQNKMREEQGVMLKELVSLSKRVGVVEEKH
jgi:uncharacterized protein YPO0396